MPKTTIDNLIYSINQMNIPDLAVDRDFASDSIVLTNTKHARRTIVDRIEIENSNLPYSVIASAIETIMPNTIPVTAVNTGAIGSSSGGAGGIQHIVNSGGGAGFGAVIKSAMQNHGALGSVMSTTYVDDPHRDVKSKLFSFDDERRILEVKQTIKAILFDTVPITALDMTRLVVAGGCFASMLNKEPVKDYDIFMLDDIDNREYVRQLSLSSEGNDDVKRGNSDYMNNKQIEHTLFFKKTGVQYITTKYKTREELIQHFDFKHCCVSYDFSKDKLYITREVYDLIKAKKLVQNNDTAPAYWRYEKFHQRGWKSDPVIVAA